MKKLFLLITFLLVSCLGVESKIVYLRLLTPFDEGREFYVGEKIKLKYSLLLFSGASLMDVEFIPSKKEELANSVEVLNPNSNWVKQEDESYENTFIYKIKSPNFAIPAIKVFAASEDGKRIDSDRVKGKKLEAIALSGERYSGVVAKKMQVSNIRTKKYDEWNNIIVFNLSVQGGNLEDFRLGGFEKQGFNSEIVGKGENQKTTYYCVFPSSFKNLKFTFFNLETYQYDEEILPVVIENDQISTQSDLEPKNNFLILGNILLLLGAIILLVLAYVYRKNKIILWLCIFISLALMAFWAYRTFASKEVLLKPNAQITILPTQNSTPMQSFDREMRVEVIGNHGEFYKIKFEDSKIGWVKKDDCQ